MSDNDTVPVFAPIPTVGKRPPGVHAMFLPLEEVEFMDVSESDRAKALERMLVLIRDVEIRPGFFGLQINRDQFNPQLN